MAATALPVAPSKGAQQTSLTQEVKMRAAPADDTALRLFTLDEYHQLIDIGFFDEDERVELLEGVLVSTSPIKPPHALTVDLLTRVFTSLFTRRNVLVRVQSPIYLPGTMTEPEPDLTIFRGSVADWKERHPSPSDILFLVEVADTSLTRDRSRKGTIYAQAGILEYWIWNLADESLEVYRDPHAPPAGDALYQTKRTFRRGDSVAPLAFPDFEVAVSEVLPSAHTNAV